ncbi:hypothetical protein CCR75_009674 [Bremia lactucae]|uniref:Peptidase S1 domain-containing protein n=1 Tax=Bremia lactucae TaxID=4779 RepID=A0A976II41_BRELC|nr:hypothetical protein CCR75_009674 [Bremia lactucae]
MKTALFTTVISAFALISAPARASPIDIRRKLILGGSVVKGHEKPYMVGLRSSETGKIFCGGALVSSTHVLAASRCTMKDIRWASIGSHTRSGNNDGELLKVMSVMNHPNYSLNIEFSHDFALLELERPSSFAPVKLAAADDSDFKEGAMATAIGFGLTSEGGVMSEKLQRVNLPLLRDDECEKSVRIDDSMVCAGGVISADVCDGDTGGPLVLEAANGHGNDVLMGVVSWSRNNACGRGPYYPGVYARVSRARKWIDSLATKSCFISGK